MSTSFFHNRSLNLVRVPMISKLFKCNWRILIKDCFKNAEKCAVDSQGHIKFCKFSLRKSFVVSQKSQTLSGTCSKIDLDCVETRKFRPFLLKHSSKSLQTTKALYSQWLPRKVKLLKHQFERPINCVHNRWSRILILTIDSSLTCSDNTVTSWLTVQSKSRIILRRWPLP
jgi:hypothetical protein